MVSLSIAAICPSFLTSDIPRPLYDVTQSFADNCVKNVSFAEYEDENEVSKCQTEKHLFGFPISSPIGIPACAIMTGNGIQWAAKAGFDILTYKTVRSAPFESHPLPNVVFLEKGELFEFEKKDSTIQISEEGYGQADEITIANSFGNPSFSLEWHLNDISKSRASLSSGQVLIVSIYGTPQEGRTYIEDYAYLGKAVSDVGAHIIEANLSCPNLGSSKQQFMYKDPEVVSTIVKAICESAPNVPVIIKVGNFDSVEQMREIFIAAEEAGASGICGINSLSMKVIHPDGAPAFGPKRQVAGVSGNQIRNVAHQFVLDARKVIDEENLGLTLFATGGIMKPEHFDLFLRAGADIVLSATGTMWNPSLAKDYHALKRNANFLEASSLIETSEY